MITAGDRLRQHFGGLLDRRLFRVRRSEPLPARLGHRRIFVLPTATGVAFGLTLMTMLLASMNYVLSLGYGLTFLLIGVGLVSLHQTFRNLVHLELLSAHLESTHCGQPATLRLRFRNPSDYPRLGLHLRRSGGGETRLSLDPHTDTNVVVAVPTNRRGRLEAGRLVLETRYPLGLVRGWSILTPEAACLVYPAPETPAREYPGAFAAGQSEQSGKLGEDDFSGLREYRPGDTLRRVAWKLSARCEDQFYTKQFDGGNAARLEFDWFRLPAELDTEARLSRLTRWVLQAEAAGVGYALRLPDGRIDADRGQTHQLQCLRALALYGIGDERS
ncbi:MAG: DUF58 domain-containing protein [Rhodocyclaceae bacterium]|nr:DUF58 domain-containing protein [Rhodocyclaceae bacterium]